MQCMLCDSLSHTHICKKCQNTLLAPSLYKRKVQNIEVVSFYKYSEIEMLLKTKHSDLGFYIYNILAKLSFKKFSKEFDFNEKVASIAIDDHTRHGYSHSAILNKQLKTKTIKPLFNKLRSQNDVTYSAKSYEFRSQNPRKFTMLPFKEKSVILVDDIITTGLTLSQAINTLRANNKEVLFCLTLADADLKDNR
ncbi:MAG: ComF family protein [Helicobacteraceae bacterium]|nr:ComF family protein [Helicobacteraceae bacterium]